MCSSIPWAIIVPPAPPPGYCRCAPGFSSVLSRGKPAHGFAQNVRLADIADARRSEVVANGLPLWHGSDLAIDATIVCPPDAARPSPPRTDVQPNSAVN